MKHTLKKSLAILLALLMLLGAMATGATAAKDAAPAASADTAEAPARPAALEKKPVLGAQKGQVRAASEGTVTVITPGTAEVSLRMDSYGDYDIVKCNLSGLVFEASGHYLSAPQTIAYDDIKNGDLQSGNVYWGAAVYYPDWRTQPDGWALGPNQAYLEVYANKYSGFHVTKTVGGVEYGTFDFYDEVFYGYTIITVNGIAASAAPILDFSSAEELTLGQPKAVSIPAPNHYNWDMECRFFKFTPAESGRYYIHSNGACYSEELYTRDGVNHSTSGVDPWVELYDQAGSFLEDNDDHENANGHRYNFGLYAALEAGKTYYLKTSAFSGGDYTILAEVNPNKLVAPKKEVTIKMGEYISMDTLLAGTTWSNSQLYVSCDGFVLEHDFDLDDWGDGYEVGYTAYRAGSETLYITAPDGEEVQIKVTVKHTFWSWVRFYLLNGWLFELTGVRRPDGAVGDIAGVMFYFIFLFGFLFAIPMMPVFMIIGLFRT